jgi:hypothetical protein
MEDKDTAASSLILLGDAPSNRLIKEMLATAVGPSHCFKLQENGSFVGGRRYSRIVIKDATEAELERLRFRGYTPTPDESDWTIDFSPEHGKILAVVSRTRNAYSYDEAAVTIFHADFGRAVEYLASVLTIDAGVAFIAKQIGWGTPWPSSFEILFSIPIAFLDMDHRRAKPEPVAWRSYTIE